jgi:hypothetical protein
MDVFPTEILRYGAYVCVRQPAAVHADVPAIARRLGLQNEFDPCPEPPRDSIAFLRRVGAAAGDLADDEVAEASAVIHVASPTQAIVTEFCAEATRLLGAPRPPRILGGVVRPMSYTGAAMNNFAYAHRVLQQPGTVMPNAFSSR